MGATLDAKFIQTEDFLTKLRAVAEYPNDGPERELFCDEEMYKDLESIHLGSGGFLWGYLDIHEYISQKLSFDLRERLDFFVSILVYGNHGHSFADTYNSEFRKIDYPEAWLVDESTIRELKGASIFLDYLKANEATLADGFQPRYKYQDLGTYIYFLERCLEVVDAAIERNCGLLIIFC